MHNLFQSTKLILSFNNCWNWRLFLFLFQLFAFGLTELHRKLEWEGGEGRRMTFQKLSELAFTVQSQQCKHPNNV